MPSKIRHYYELLGNSRKPVAVAEYLPKGSRPTNSTGRESAMAWVRFQIGEETALIPASQLAEAAEWAEGRLKDEEDRGRIR
jgi:hypothetical protein